MDPGELLDRLLRLTDAVSLDMDSHLAGLGLTRTKGHLLWVLHGGGPARQRDLATALGHTPRHVTTLVDELITTGYVTRRPHPDDRRAVLVELTARGSSLLDEMARSRTALSDRLFGGLAVRQRTELGDRLAELHTTVTALIEEQRATEAGGVSS